MSSKWVYIFKVILLSWCKNRNILKPCSIDCLWQRKRRYCFLKNKEIHYSCIFTHNFSLKKVDTLCLGELNLYIFIMPFFVYRIFSNRYWKYNININIQHNYNILPSTFYTVLQKRKVQQSIVFMLIYLIVMIRQGYNRNHLRHQANVPSGSIRID